MRKLYPLIFLTLLGTTPAHSAVMTFDDIPAGSLQGQVGSMPTYQGFTFSSTLDWIDVVESSWPYGAHSGEFALLNNEHGVGVISKADLSDFTFNSLWAKKWATTPESGNSAGTLSGYIAGYNNGVQVWSINTVLNGSYQFIGGSTQAIDQLHLGLGNNFLVDDITVNAVPVPGAIWLFGSVLAGLGIAGNRKKSKN